MQVRAVNYLENYFDNVKISTTNLFQDNGAIMNTDNSNQGFNPVQNYGTWRSHQIGWLFEDISQQSFMGKSIPQLFADYSNTGIDFSTEDWYKNDFSASSPTGTTIYTKPNDGGTHNKVAVIDAFNGDNSEVSMSLDSTTSTTISHGEFVASLLESQINEYGLNYTVDRLGIDIVDGVLQNGVEQMDYILANISEYRAVNVSLCDYINYTTVSSIVGYTVTPENLAQAKEEIISIIMSDDVTALYEKNLETLNEGYIPDYSELVENGTFTQEEAEQVTNTLILRYKIEQMGEFYAKADKIAEQGVPVFMAAGNYEDQFNLGALLTDNVEYIGANDETFTNPYTGYSAGFSSNSLVTREGEETYTGNNVIDGKIDIDNNGSGDISAEGVDTDTIFVTGTSFASPYALVQALYQADTTTATNNTSNNNQNNTTNQQVLYTNNGYYTNKPSRINSNLYQEKAAKYAYSIESTMGRGFINQAVNYYDDPSRGGAFRVDFSSDMIDEYFAQNKF